MARRRVVKPEFWTDEVTGNLEDGFQALFIGMWNFSDDEGLIQANPIYLQATIFPYKKDQWPPERIQKSLAEFTDKKLIHLYTRNIQNYAWVIKFRKHQRIDRPQLPQNPPPSIRDDNYHQALFKRDNFICTHCGEYTNMEDVGGEEQPIIEYIIPKTEKGTDYPTNLITSCRGCLSCTDSIVKYNSPKNEEDENHEKHPDSKNGHGTLFTYSKNGPEQAKLSKAKLSKRTRDKSLAVIEDSFVLADTLNKKPQNEKKDYNPYKHLSQLIYKKGHHLEAIKEAFESLIKHWPPKTTPYAYVNGILKTTNQNWMEKDHMTSMADLKQDIEESLKNPKLINLLQNLKFME